VLLQQLQDLLAGLYGIELDANVTDYLVTDERFLAVLTDDQPHSADETLFVREDGDALDMTLYLNDALLQRLAESDPYNDLSHSNLDDFCKVLEGVSHFVYMAWNALNDKPVTRLELELQSEVDKYISSRLLLESQVRPGIDPGIDKELLKQHLFDNVFYLDSLTDVMRDRYQHANDSVSRYCHNLEQRFSAERVSAAMVQELREFYRMPQPAKFSHLNSVQFASM
jgi:hypothetical protein